MKTFGEWLETVQMTNRGHRVNKNWAALKAGDPVVSDYIKNSKGQFIPFRFEPVGHAPEMTRCPLGGVLQADLCFPYGELQDNGYADFRQPHNP